MAIIIDRSKTNTNKSAGNRRRFIERHKAKIKEAISKKFKEGNITDIGDDTAVDIEIDTEEYGFVRDPKTGEHTQVVPGNPGVYKGDAINRPRGQESEDAGSEPGKGEGEDAFTFVLNDKEFRDLLFEFLELPDFVKQTIHKDVAFKLRQAGYKSTGIPSQLSVIRSYLNSYARRKAIIASIDDEIEHEEDEAKKLELEERKKKIPVFDDVDLRFKNFEKQPIPINAAVMICVMDVSGSMTEELKTRAKKFFYMLYLFLKAKYEHTDIIFISHTDTPEEVDEETFFYGRRSGGTEIKPALELAKSIITSRYDVSKWNVYIAQASDGGAFGNDAHESAQYIQKELSPMMQFMAYLECSASYIRRDYTSKYFRELDQLENKKVQVKKATRDSEVFDVFVELFKKRS